jgi:Tol biopolymer transport system component
MTAPARRARRWALTGVVTAGLVAPAAGQAAIAFQRQPGSLSAMYVASDEGTHVRRLPVGGTGPVISPDGTRVAFQRLTRDGEGRLRILTIAGGPVVVSPTVCGSAPVWSPDSTRLLCTTESARRDGTVTGEGLVLIDAATGASQTLVPAPRHDVETVAWSPDGTRIAYSDGRFGATRADVYVADPAHMAGATRVVRDADTPVWGPTAIAVTRYTHRRVRIHGRRTTVVHSQIWTVVPGSRARALTRYRARSILVTGPSPTVWTPRGKLLVGEITGTDHSQLIAVDARTGRIHALRPAAERATFANAVSADGRTVLFTDAADELRPSLRTVRITGGTARVLLRGVSTVSVSAGWSP